jgi:glycosyltransferase involved in cell wall biosynthesis
MKHVSVVAPCYNEQENVEELYARVVAAMSRCPAYTFDLLYIDNASTDRTVEILRRLAAKDPRVRVIVNARNFGHIRSPYHGLLQAQGDAVIGMASDLQDPPELIPEFIARWEAGYKVVMGVKSRSEETAIFYALRSLFYRTLRRLSEIELVEHFTGFGLYDRQVMDVLRSISDPYPYFRGLIADIGFESARIEFLQPGRKRGVTKNNFYTLFDMAMLGFTNHSKVPLRLATLVGFATGCLSFLVGLFYLGYKLANWSQFQLGLAPLVIGLFFFSSVQLIFLGIVGEYVGAIHTQVLNRPLVVERERINFAAQGTAGDAPPSPGRAG